MQDETVKLILITDDDSARLRANADILSENGFEVLKVENVSEPFQVILKNKPAIILLTDSDLLTRIKSETSLSSSLVIQILEAQSDINQDADAYLKTPFSAEEFLKQVKLLLRLQAVESQTALAINGKSFAGISHHVKPKISAGEQIQSVGIAENITEYNQVLESLPVAERLTSQNYLELFSRIVPLAQTLGTARNFLTIYREIGEFIRASMPCVGFFVSFYDAQRSQRIAAYAWGESGEVDISTLPPMPLTEDGGPNSRAIFSGKTQVVDRYMDMMRTRPHIIVQENGVDPQASLVVPLVFMGRVTGTFEVQAYESGSFQDEHIFALEMVASLTAVAIENVRLLESEAKARQDAERANHAKDEFIAVVSHELRSPLNAIMGWARLLQNKQIQNVNLEQGLETIVRNARIQSKLIEDLLDTARITSGKLRLEIHPVNLLELIRGVLDITKPTAAAKDIIITANFDSAINLIQGDSDRIQQIISNLLSNAIKFTPKGGNINVDLQRQDSNAVIIITDSGIGINPEFLPHIFDQFSQADPDSTRRHGGLGLGLALARKLSEMHGGTITAQSEGVGKGAQFTVTLPLRSSPPFIDNVNFEKGKHMNNEGKLKNLWVLIVDDEADARDMVSFMLQINGARVTTARSAVEAIEVLKNISEFDPYPDVIVSDIGMPNEDGYALMQKIRALSGSPCAKIPAIALTAFNRPEDRQNALDAGFQMHIGKPVEPERLTAAISEVASYKVL
jgi:signal transduction histidine kinase/CheY-like chemotaxis protein